MAQTSQDVVFSNMRINDLPTGDDAITYEAALKRGDTLVSVVPLQHSQDGFQTARPLKGPKSPDLTLHVREVGSESALFKSEPLYAPGSPGAAGQVRGAGLSGGSGSPTLSCDWRLQRSLPPITKYRTRPLALRYSAHNDRTSFEHRLNDWRVELNENRTLPPGEWSQPWRPPYRPHHLLGDPVTQRRREAYINAAAEDVVSLSAQAVAVQLKRLQDQLPVCQTADQAVSALVAIRDFLETPGNMEQIDAALVLRQIRHLRLPFERLVRNVWQEGPEVAYDRTKAALQRVLQKEVARRKAHAAAVAAGALAPPSAPLATTIGGDEFVLTAPTTRPPGLTMSSTRTDGVRSGLLTFAGASVDKNQGRPAAEEVR